MVHNVKLCATETVFYFFVWTSGITYSTYNVYLINRYFIDYKDLYNDFDTGWSWIGKKRDISDEEWQTWIPLLKKTIVWIFFHHAIAQIIKRVVNKDVDDSSDNRTVLCTWYIFSSSFYLCYLVGIKGTICILIQPLALYFISNVVSNKKVLWFIYVSISVGINILKLPGGSFENWLGSNENQCVVTLAMCWVQLRTISATFDSKTDSCQIFNLLSITAYAIYMPTLILGPLILYNEFIESMNKYTPWNLNKMKTFILKITRYIFWVYLTEFLLHFIYVNAIKYHPRTVETLNPWALYGLGYCMGQYFLIKYVIVYGINGAICEIDDIKCPPQPKCIARIHLYSDMWKYFDTGMYKFLVRYIYLPSKKSYSNKLWASFLCFSFVFLWHGMQMDIFIWSFLNLIGLIIEDLMKGFVNDGYSKTARRLHCIWASPLLAMSAISNFYFFAGQEIGNIFMKRIFIEESWTSILILLFFLYCCCNVSIDAKRWENSVTKIHARRTSKS